MDLLELSRSYLEAEGYDVVQRGRDQLIGTQRTLGEDVQSIYVWTLQPSGPISFRSSEGAYLERFKEASEMQPFAQKFVVAPNLEGLSSDFRKSSLQLYNVKIRVPVQFFDTAFKWEQSPDAPSAARELRARGEAIIGRRIAQPFSADVSSFRSDDLLEHLVERLRRRQEGERSIHIVVGPAGIGKSYLFEALFARLYDSFLADKRAQRLAARPLPLLPQYLPLSDAPSIRALQRAYLQSDFARPLTGRVFEWMLSHGLAMWMLDGLDEVINEDLDFFDYILDLMTAPGGANPPTIVICLRDALLGTHGALRDFVEDAAGRVAIYRLEGWGQESKTRFARLVLPSGQADQFVAALAESPRLDQIASTPYYCRLLTEQWSEGHFEESLSEVDLVRYALARIVGREYDKQLIDPLYVRPVDLIELIEALAVEDLERGFQGVPVDEAESLAQIILPDSGLPEPQLRSLTAQLTQLGLFGYAGVGQIRFVQEILEHYLLGQWLCRRFDHGEDSLIDALAVRRLPSDWITFAVLLEHISAKAMIDRILPLIVKSIGRGSAFKNLVQLTALAPEAGRILRAVPFERQDLGGLRFTGLDFEGVSFCGCDLSDSEFRDCNLRRVNLADSILRNTLMMPVKPNGLSGAMVGQLTRFYSIRIDGRRTLDDRAAAAKWFQREIGSSVQLPEQCPAALQLRHLFGKFVDPTGRPKRARLDRKGVLAGRQFYRPEDVLAAAVRYGFLHSDDFRGRIARVDGPVYSELVSFVSSQKLSTSIRQLLSDVCDRTGCSHSLGEVGREST